jgi:aurora kinase
MGSSGSSVASRAASCITPAEDFQDFHDKYLLGPKLGRGAFAEVYVTKKIHDDTAQASKQKAVKVSSRETQKQKKAMLLEEELWLAVSQHDNCVRLYEAFHSDTLSYMVMERCSCSLLHHIKTIPDLTERTLGPIFSQMLQSLYQVHSAHVVHRDIKPDNFLIGGEDGQTVKLCDFGLSARLCKGTKHLTDIVGTPPFMCPEMLLGKGCDFKADVWSVGVVAYAFLFGIFPYMPKARSSRLMKNAIIDGVSPAFAPVGRHLTNASKFRSSTILEFVKSLLNRQPEQRPSALEALNMEYMIAIADNCHAPSVDLPSLEPTISSAKEMGVFEFQDVHRTVDIDIVLNDLQMEKHQVPLFKRRSSKTITRKGSKDSSSPDNVSLASTACPSELQSRQPSKISVETRLSSKTSFGARISSKPSVEGSLSPKSMGTSNSLSVEGSPSPKSMGKSNSLNSACHETVFEVKAEA